MGKDMGNSNSNGNSNSRECLTWAKELKINSSTTIDDVHKHRIQAPDCVGFGNYAGSSEQFTLSDVFPGGDYHENKGYEDKRLNIPFSCIRLSDFLRTDVAKSTNCDPDKSSYPEGDSDGATDYPFKLIMNDGATPIE